MDEHEHAYRIGVALASVVRRMEAFAGIFDKDVLMRSNKALRTAGTESGRRNHSVLLVSHAAIRIHPRSPSLCPDEGYGRKAEVTIGLSGEARRNLVERLRAVDLDGIDGESQAELIEPDSPELAQHVRTVSPADLTTSNLRCR